MYRGRIAPTPTGHLHVGHARTFALAAQRAKAAGGKLVFRTEDLDGARCRPEFVESAIADLQWLGIRWDEGPDIGGPYAPYTQSQRLDWYQSVWNKLHATGLLYPCNKSRRDVENALVAPHAEDDAEPVFPLAFRPELSIGQEATEPGQTNWRFRIPWGEKIVFQDVLQGPQTFTAGEDFGDFLVWRKDGFPSYELAVVADDYAMKITEVVRGADLLLSTARQLLLYRALQWQPPAWAHAPLVKDEQGQRLAKRAQGLTLCTLREKGKTPTQILTEPLANLRN